MILSDKTSVGTIIGRTILIDADDSNVMNQRTVRLTSKGCIQPKYLHFLINSDVIHKRIASLAQPAPQIYVNTDDVLTFELPFPLAIEEQVAIATVLTDIDNEITSLEACLSNTKVIKQGMMQELFTGLTRLVGVPLADDEVQKEELRMHEA